MYVKQLKELQQTIGYMFREEHLLKQALTHSSYAHETMVKKVTYNEDFAYIHFG